MIECTLADEAGEPRGFKVGVIGFAPPQIAQWDEALVAGVLTSLDIVETARAEIGALRGRGVDLVVALCHSGISRLPSRLGEENAALDLAKVDGIDALFLGHQHLLFPGEDFADVDGLDAARGTIHGKPAVMAGFWGSHLGVIDIALEQAAAGWRVANAQVEIRPIAKRNQTAPPSRSSNPNRPCSRRLGPRIWRRSTTCAGRSENLPSRCTRIWR